MRILDIGCDGEKFKGSLDDIIVGLDVQKFPGVDVVHDLEDIPLPFESGSFDMVYADGILEHVRGIIPLMNDIWRILKKDSILKAVLPHRTNPFASHIEHVSYWSLVSFDCLYDKECLVKGFKVVKREIRLIRPYWIFNKFASRFPNFYEWRLSMFMPAKEIVIELKKMG